MSWVFAWEKVRSRLRDSTRYSLVFLSYDALEALLLPQFFVLFHSLNVDPIHCPLALLGPAPSYKT